MKDEIMILGVGIYKVPLIKKAREMGLKAFSSQPKGKSPEIALADIFLDIDTTDGDRILQAPKITLFQV